MTGAVQVQGGPSTRYKIKIVPDVRSRITGMFDYEKILEALETHHEEGWDVCASQPAEDGSLVITYRRAVA